MNQIDHTASQSSDSQQPNRLDIVRSLLELRVQYVDEHQDLQGKMDVLLRKIDAVDLLIESETAGIEPDMTAGGITSDEVVESPTADTLESDDTTDEAGLVSGIATVKDILHCRTQREAGYVIAEINGGHIDLKSAARVIDAAGLSKGLLNTIVSSLHNFMSHSDDWSYTGPSRFELLTRREGALASASEPDSGDEELPKSNVVQGNSMMAHMLDETAA